MLAGAPVDEAKLANEFDAVIASFEGETNWGMTINDAEKLGERVGFVVGALAGPFCCLIVAGAVAFALFRKRPAKK